MTFKSWARASPDLNEPSNLWMEMTFISLSSSAGSAKGAGGAVDSTTEGESNASQNNYLKFN